MKTSMARFLVFAALAVAVVLGGSVWAVPIQTQAQEDPEGPEVPLIPEDPADPEDPCPSASDDDREKIADVVERVSPRANLSRHHNAIFIEWKIIHNVDLEEWTHPETGETFDAVGLGATKDQLGELPTSFELERSLDGGNTWANIATVDNDPDRYDAEVAEVDRQVTALRGSGLSDEERHWEYITRLETVRLQGRQLSYYDNTILWPPRYPGHTYKYRVVVVWNENCSAIAPQLIPLEVTVEDPTPTTFPDNETVDTDALKTVFNPQSGIGEKGYYVSWNGIAEHLNHRLVRDNTTVKNRADDHTAARPDSAKNEIPNFVVQRAEGATVTDTTYFATIANLANDGLGRQQTFIDTTVQAGTTYTYRLVAVYGERQGVTFQMEAVAPITVSEPADFDSRYLRRLLKARSNLVVNRGIVVKWNNIANNLWNNSRESAPPGYEGSVPSHFLVQRASVHHSVTTAPDAGYVTVAKYANDTDGGRQTHVDSAAGVGFNHFYRIAAVYNDNTLGEIVVAPIPMRGVKVPPETPLNLFDGSHPQPGTAGMAVSFRQVYWTPLYAVFRADSRNGVYEFIDSVRHKEGSPTQTYVDTNRKWDTSGQGPVVQSCYKIVTYPRGEEPLSSTAGCTPLLHIVPD